MSARDAKAESRRDNAGDETDTGQEGLREEPAARNGAVEAATRELGRDNGERGME